MVVYIPNHKVTNVSFLLSEDNSTLRHCITLVYVVNRSIVPTFSTIVALTITENNISCQSHAHSLNEGCHFC